MSRFPIFLASIRFHSRGAAIDSEHNVCAIAYFFDARRKLFFRKVRFCIFSFEYEKSDNLKVGKRALLGLTNMEDQ